MTFIDGFVSEGRFDDRTKAVLRAAGVRNATQVLGLVNNFPSIAQFGVNVSKLRAAALRHMPRRAGLSPIKVTRPKFMSFGALYPGGAAALPRTPIGFPPRAGSVPGRAGAGSPGSGTAGGAGRSGSIDVSWQGRRVRDQGERMTCVAFASNACCEERLMVNGLPDLSPQFLYWATKTNGHDPDVGSDGTLLTYAALALEVDGLCTESEWPYDGQSIPGDVAHATRGPSPAAIQNARSRTFPRTILWSITNGQAASTGVAAELERILRIEKRPVAITVSLFQDPSSPTQATNWTAEEVIENGLVIDPPPAAMPLGMGHAVCLTGYIPDSSEPSGGYFVFLNSWGTMWASAHPPSSPGPGFGQISASYVDEHTWEYLVL